MARFLHLPPSDEVAEEDPLAGIANLFDVSIVFIVGLMISLFSVYRHGRSGRREERGDDGEDQRAGRARDHRQEGHDRSPPTKSAARPTAGDGERLGTAYRLANGQIIYVPERRRVRRTRVAAGACACLASARSLAGAMLRGAARRSRPVRVAFLYSDGNMPGTLKAFKALLDERPDLRGQVTLTLSHRVGVRRRQAGGPDRAPTCSCSTSMNQQMLDRFNAQHQIDLIAGVRAQRQGAARSAKGCCRRRRYIEQGVHLGRTRARLLGAFRLRESARR